MRTLSNSQDDHMLLEQMASGNTEAFSRLYEKYWDPLFLTAANVMRSKEDAADVVQDVFLSLWNRRQELDINQSVIGYLQTSARYKAIHYIEKNITRRDFLAMLTETEVACSSLSPEYQFQLKELQEVVHKAVKQMPPRRQEVYLLSRQQQMSYKEIAEFLGVSDETVKTHLKHALSTIKIALNTLPNTPAALVILLILKNS